MKTQTPWTMHARQAAAEWKARTTTLPEAARADGHYFVEDHGQSTKIGPFSFCLPIEYAELNLLSRIRSEALSRFRRHEIPWHAGAPGDRGTNPCAHLLDSQVQCVNVLLSLAEAPERLLTFVRQVVPDAQALVSVEDGSPVAFEWIGLADYLGEGRGRPRRRGQFATSADAILVAERRDGGRTGIVLEWKFTEFYERPVPIRGPGGTDRRAVYRSLYEATGSSFVLKPSIDVFMQEPHYQLLRLALLSAAMVNARELDIDEAVLLNVVPGGNAELLALIPAGLREFGQTVDAVWTTLLPGPRVRYQMADSLPLMALTPELHERYGDLTPLRRT